MSESASPEHAAHEAGRQQGMRQEQARGMEQGGSNAVAKADARQGGRR